MGTVSTEHALTPTAPARDVVVADNVIEDAGHVVPAGTGVLAQECANTTITHNHIHHCECLALSAPFHACAAPALQLARARMTH